MAKDSTWNCHMAYIINIMFRTYPLFLSAPKFIGSLFIAFECFLGSKTHGLLCKLQHTNHESRQKWIVSCLRN